MILFFSFLFIFPPTFLMLHVSFCPSISIYPFMSLLFFLLLLVLSSFKFLFLSFFPSLCCPSPWDWSLWSLFPDKHWQFVYNHRRRSIQTICSFLVPKKFSRFSTRTNGRCLFATRETPPSSNLCWPNPNTIWDVSKLLARLPAARYVLHGVDVLWSKPSEKLQIKIKKYKNTIEKNMKEINSTRLQVRMKCSLNLYCTKNVCFFESIIGD